MALFNQAARDLYDQISRRWTALEDWYTDPKNSAAASHLRQIDKLIAHWHEVDEGRWFSDPSGIDGSSLDLDTAEDYAHEQGFPLPPEHRKRTVTTEQLVNAGDGLKEAAKIAGVDLPTGIADQEWVVKQANSIPILKTLTDPRDRSWCQRVGAPDLICDKDGLEPWFIIAVGGAGMVIFGSLLYGYYRAARVVAPIALGLSAPHLLPAYQQLVPDRDVDRRKREQVLQALHEMGVSF